MNTHQIHTPLGAVFFDRPAQEVAEELLGKFLIREKNSVQYAFMITDVEAYEGLKDKASHAHRGRTKRNEPMFGSPGIWYVYFVYGMHWLLNIVTGNEGHPGAVLIRGIQHVSGPAKLTKFLTISSKENKMQATPENKLWIGDRNIYIPKKIIKKVPRVGVGYAGPVWAKKPYRYVVKEC
ncbi:MAG: 3-methyladenine DNA glycosylase [Candidatus Harrisonbacteria bacterium CG10_big_fil_rev_8_21_14_0_10_42_17]|uniref:Putative 3-methyladenine DNA glycosylase n=1 Tax=Candidatus Harrisonbacteria bacterium CG10_big_fil_rev_8_21_14_0_10_42_17 TaxID=1974584 RepID=A0A2M6WIH3_9BACT|nr:MAG: 3-methyladenine DNA glycosylase [Candidatus Harrisonbacteria bacterium CG10_big_fil_rev_8_21_14_0_10_42_17]